MSKHYLTQFKDFDNGDLFDKLLWALKPYGFEDTSWKNDTCPSIGKQKNEEDYIQIFVDYKDHNLSEFPECRSEGRMKVFSVYSDMDTIEIETDSIQEALKKVLEIKGAK